MKGCSQELLLPIRVDFIEGHVEHRYLVLLVLFYLTCLPIVKLFELLSLIHLLYSVEFVVVDLEVRAVFALSIVFLLAVVIHYVLQGRISAARAPVCRLGVSELGAGRLESRMASGRGLASALGLPQQEVVDGAGLHVDLDVANLKSFLMRVAIKSLKNCVSMIMGTLPVCSAVRSLCFSVLTFAEGFC